MAWFIMNLLLGFGPMMLLASLSFAIATTVTKTYEYFIPAIMAFIACLAIGIAHTMKLLGV